MEDCRIRVLTRERKDSLGVVIVIRYLRKGENEKGLSTLALINSVPGDLDEEIQQCNGRHRASIPVVFHDSWNATRSRIECDAKEVVHENNMCWYPLLRFIITNSTHVYRGAISASHCQTAVQTLLDHLYTMNMNTNPLPTPLLACTPFASRRPRLPITR